MYNDCQLKDIDRFCGNECGTNVFCIDTTFNVGNFFVTTSSFVDISLRTLSNNDDPTFIGPCMIHFEKSADVFKYFLSEMKHNLKHDL